MGRQRRSALQETEQGELTGMGAGRGGAVVAGEGGSIQRDATSVFTAVDPYEGKAGKKTQ